MKNSNIEYEEADLYISLLFYQELPAKERLAILQTEMLSLISLLCGFSELFKIKFESAGLSEAGFVQNFQMQLSDICTSLRKLNVDSKAMAALTEDKAQAALSLYRSNQDLANRIDVLSQQLPELDDSLAKVLDNIEFWTDRLAHTAMKLRVMIHTLCHIDSLTIPEEILSGYEISQALSSKPGDPKLLSTVLQAARHPLGVMRKRAALLCRHYPPESVTSTLIDLLHDDAEEVVVEAADSLRHLKVQAAIPELIQCLEREFDKPAYTGWIADALSEMPDERALMPLIRTLDRLMGKAHLLQGAEFHPLAGVRKALQAIGGAEAEASLKRYFG